MCLRARDDTVARRRRQTHGLPSADAVCDSTRVIRYRRLSYLLAQPRTRTQNPHADTHTLQPAPHALNQSRHPTPVSGWRLRPHLPDLRPAGLPLLLQAGLIG